MSNIIGSRMTLSFATRGRQLGIGGGIIPKILLTGGAGFIGSHTAHLMFTCGVDVSIVDAFRPYSRPAVGSGGSRDLVFRESLIAGLPTDAIDLNDTPALMRILDKLRPEVVVNLAAHPLVGTAEEAPELCRRDIIESVSSLCRAVENAPSVRRLVHISSSMVYGNFQSERIDENHPTEPVNAYGRFKLEAERIVRTMAGRTGRDIVIVRPMAVYGLGDFYQRLIPIFATRALAGVPLSVDASSDHRIDFSYVEDIAEGLLLAATLPDAAGHTFNMTSGAAHSLLELVELLKSYVPDLVYELTPPTGPKRPSRGALDISKARAVLGYRPRTPLERGLERCIDFKRNQAEPMLVRAAS